MPISQIVYSRTLSYVRSGRSATAIRIGALVVVSVGFVVLMVVGLSAEGGE